MSFYVNDQEKYLVYAEKWDEMSFDKYRVNFSWNEITDDTVIVNKNGLPLHIGYELEINGATNEADYLDGSFVDEKDGSVHRMVTGNNSTVPYVLVGAGETVSMRVCAVYYHSNDVIYDENNPGQSVYQTEDMLYVADMYDEWSTEDYVELQADREKPYYYFAVEVAGAEEGYLTDGKVSMVSGVAQTATNTPEIKNFQVIKTANGNAAELSWTPVDANVVIYVIEGTKIPTYYNYGILSAYGYYTDSEGNKEKVDYSVPAYQDGNRTITKVPVNLTYYTATGKEEKATYTAKITKPSVRYAAAKTSVKLTMSASNYTGFEIYRLSGKKYPKIATVTENTYTDVDLKEDTKYSYKVRAYYYGADSKAKSYSEYKAISVTTSQTKNFTAKVTKASKTSAKVTWTKVSGEKKYYVYRATKKNGTYTLLGSTTKTSYTDKKASKGKTYYYKVVVKGTNDLKADFSIESAVKSVKVKK